MLRVREGKEHNLFKMAREESTKKMKAEIHLKGRPGYEQSRKKKEIPGGKNGVLPIYSTSSHINLEMDLSTCF
jgi:hypothetical protein